jgi:hypothetical protein
MLVFGQAVQVHLGVPRSHVLTSWTTSAYIFAAWVTFSTSQDVARDQQHLECRERLTNVLATVGQRKQQMARQEGIDT